MRQLIWKDLMIQKRMSFVYVTAGVLYIFFLNALGYKNLFNVMLPAFILVYSYMIRSMLEDEKNHAIRMLVSLPITRERIVTAKYISVGLAAIAASIVFLSAGALSGSYSLSNPENRVMNLWGIAAFTFVSAFLLSIFMPLVYRLGAIRAQYAHHIIFFGLLVLGSTTTDAAMKRIADMNPYLGIVSLLVLSALLYIGSLRISIRFLNNRELL